MQNPGHASRTSSNRLGVADHTGLAPRRPWIKPSGRTRYFFPPGADPPVPVEVWPVVAPEELLALLLFAFQGCHNNSAPMITTTAMMAAMVPVPIPSRSSRGSRRRLLSRSLIELLRLVQPRKRAFAAIVPKPISGRG